MLVPLTAAAGRLAAHGLASWLLRLPELGRSLHWAASLLSRGARPEDGASEGGSG